MGEFITYKIIPIGYEDLNIKLSTSQGIFLVKIFASFHDKRECEQYKEIIIKALEAGVSHPKLYSSQDGYLYTFTYESISIYLCVLEYINGNNFLELGKKIIKEEASFILKQISLINKIKLKPYSLYDSWAITNLLKEYNKKICSE